MTDQPKSPARPVSRAGWLDAATVNGFYPTNDELGIGWNEWLSVRRAVILQSPDDTKYQNNLRRLLIADCERGAFVCRQVPKRVGGIYMYCTDEDGQGFTHQTPERNETEYLVESSVFLSWLFIQGLLPSKHVTAWNAATSNPAPEPQVETVATASDGHRPLRINRRTWRDVAWTYMAEIFKAGRYTTAKQFYQALEKKAGTDSPFDRGTGQNSNSLFVREISESLTLKTVQNNWADIKATRNSG